MTGQNVMTGLDPVISRTIVPRPVARLLRHAPSIRGGNFPFQILHLRQVSRKSPLLKRDRDVTTQVLQFAELSDQDRKQDVRLGKVEAGDLVEVRVKRRAGGDQTLSLPPQAAALVELLLEHLFLGERVAVLAEDQELSPNEAASILGISRPFVVHRMDVGDLPFRYVGTHRRAKLKDVLALKTEIDARNAAMEALAGDAEDLKQLYGV